MTEQPMSDEQQDLPEPGSVWRKGDRTRTVSAVVTLHEHKRKKWRGQHVNYVDSTEPDNWCNGSSMRTWRTWAADAERVVPYRGNIPYVSKNAT